MSYNYTGYAILLAFLILFGLMMSYFDLSVWWAILPLLIGGFAGAYMSPFSQVLLAQETPPDKREKVLQTLRVLTLGWTLLSGVFVAMGYSLLVLIR
jgi:MFS family permease